MNFSMRSLFLISFIGIFICGCSSNSSQPISPSNSDSSSGPILSDARDANSTGANHYLMQYGYIFVDPYHPDGPQFEVIPARQGEFHLNILKLLEINPYGDCFRIVGLDIPWPGVLNVDIQVEHPLNDLDYSVFDVRGIMMFNGSYEFPISGKTISDPTLGDGILLNPDGYTALYNGSTFAAPTGDLQKYFPGKLAIPVVLDSDINGYKYFITDDPSNNRNAFYAGSSDVQTFSLQPPSGPFVFGYAVDANWWTPISSPVNDPLTDFDENSNCTEPWKVVVTEEKIGYGLTVQGGQTKLLIDVYDWQGKSTHHAPVVECPEIFDGELTATWVSDGADFTRFEVSVSNDKLASVGKYICLVGVEAIENNPAETPWLDLTAYQCHSLEVSGGHLLWAKGVGTTYTEKGYAVTALSDNSTVLTGGFVGSITFGLGEPNETVLISVGSCDIYIARYNPDGSLAWVKQAGGLKLYFESGRGITALPDNSVVVTGQFKDIAIFGAGEPNETVLNAAECYNIDIFIARYNSDGSLEWAKRAGGPVWPTAHENSSCGKGITALSDNSIVMTGWFSESVTFGPGEPNETVLNSTGPGDGDIFIARYNPDGSLEWAKRAGGLSNKYYEECGQGITALSDNSTVVTGLFIDFSTFGPGEPNETVLISEGNFGIFIARYNPDGSLAWAKQAGGTSSDYGYGVTALSDDSIVVTGSFRKTATFGQGEPNETVLKPTNPGGSQIFIARYNPDGSLEWAKQAGGIDHDTGSGITTLSDNSTAVTGKFGDSATFGPGEPNETILDSWGLYDYDIFIARYNPDGSLEWARRAGGMYAGTENMESGLGITALSDNSTVVTGWFTGYATFGQLEPNETVLHSAGRWDIFIARYAE